MRQIVKTPLEQVRAKEEELKAKDQQLQNLGLSLTQEKIKNVQKEAMINNLGQELAGLKIEILKLKGAVGQ